jgi:hypothetical protein
MFFSLFKALRFEMEAETCLSGLRAARLITFNYHKSGLREERRSSEGGICDKGKKEEVSIVIIADLKLLEAGLHGATLTSFSCWSHHLFAFV